MDSFSYVYPIPRIHTCDLSCEKVKLNHCFEAIYFIFGIFYLKLKNRLTVAAQSTKSFDLGKYAAMKYSHDINFGNSEKMLY